MSEPSKDPVSESARLWTASGLVRALELIGVEQAATAQAPDEGAAVQAAEEDEE